MSKNPNSQRNQIRKKNNRELRQRFLIICEGTKTEPNYFNSFPVSRNVIALHVKGVGKNPSKLIQKAKELAKEEEYDQIWCVFDRDDWIPTDFNNAIRDAEKEGFKVAYSNEAFELWYILHFEFLTAGIRRSVYIDKLTKLLGNRYLKNSPSIYNELYCKQATAIKNAENLLKQYKLHNPSNDNPSTTVHLLVKELNRFIT